MLSNQPGQSAEKPATVEPLPEPFRFTAADILIPKASPFRTPKPREASQHLLSPGEVTESLPANTTEVPLDPKPQG